MTSCTITSELPPAFEPDPVPLHTYLGATISHMTSRSRFLQKIAITALARGTVANR